MVEILISREGVANYCICDSKIFKTDGTDSREINRFVFNFLIKHRISKSIADKAARFCVNSCKKNEYPMFGYSETDFEIKFREIYE